MNKLDEFYYTCKSPETREKYEYYFRYFESFAKMPVTKLLKLPPKKIQDILTKYAIDMRDRSLSSSSISGRISPILTFLELNDVMLNKKRIMRFVGEHKKFKDLAYTHEDLELMTSLAKPRTKLIILIYSSTGIRRAALCELKLKHIEKVTEFNLYKFTIYENTNQEHITYCTPECASAIDDYLRLREEAGEQISKESWLVRNDFNVHNRKSALNAKPSHPTAINTLVRNLLVKSRIRPLNRARIMRNDKSAIHAFRKYTTTQFVKSNVNPEIREILLNHKIGLAGVYYRPSEEDILKEYAKAINALTIDPTMRLKREIKILSDREKLFTKYEKQIKALEEKQERNDKLMAELEKSKSPFRKLLFQLIKQGEQSKTSIKET